MRVEYRYRQYISVEKGQNVGFSYPCTLYTLTQGYSLAVREHLDNIPRVPSLLLPTNIQSSCVHILFVPCGVNYVEFFVSVHTIYAS